VLLSKDEEQWCYPSETLLFFADRVQHLNERVFPVLKAGGIYISDRYIDSTFAYQGLRGYNLSFIKSLIQVLDIPAPDITFWIKLDPEIAYARAQARAEQNLYDAKPLLFYQQLEEMYRRNFEHDPRVATIDASGSVEEVAERVWAEYGRRKKLRRCCF
jgi:dTMP kinase